MFVMFITHIFFLFLHASLSSNDSCIAIYLFYRRNMSNITYIAKKRTFVIPENNVTFSTLTDLFFIDKKYRSCPNLDLVIRQLNFDFYHDLLPIIAQWAS